MSKRNSQKTTQYKEVCELGNAKEMLHEQGLSALTWNVFMDMENDPSKRTWEYEDTKKFLIEMDRKMAERAKRRRQLR